MKKTGKATLLLVALALVLGLGLASFGWAQPMGMSHGQGMGMMNLTTEQATKIFDLKEKFRTDTAGLRKDMMIKRLEMRDLWKAASPDQNAILAKQKEINALRDQLSLKMVAFRLEAKKIAPQAAFGMGRGHGKGMMGYGMGQGGGCGMGAGGGMGMGKCPAAAAPAETPAK